MPPPPRRTLGLDYGTRRIGLALSDPTGTLATPLATLTRRVGKRPPMARILELARERRVGRFVVGLPLDPGGGENSWTNEVRDFGRRLEDRSGLPVHFIDEEYSSAEAEARIRSIGLTGKRRRDKARIDAAAAAIILQDWLDAHPLDAPAPLDERRDQTGRGNRTRRTRRRNDHRRGPRPGQHPAHRRGSG